jgi:hypothetical protein
MFTGREDEDNCVKNLERFFENQQAYPSALI